jgi:hypothetical protein
VGTVLAMAGGGCTHWKVRTDYQPAAQLQSARTFAWTNEVDNGAFYRSLSGQRVQAIVNHSLEERGLRPAAPGQTPDVLVAAHFDDDGTAVYPGTFPGPPGGNGVYGYTVGTLTIDVMQPGSKRVVWHARASKPKRDPYFDAHDALSATGRIMARYPYGPRREQVLDLPIPTTSNPTP